MAAQQSVVRGDPEIVAGRAVRTKEPRLSAAWDRTVGWCTFAAAGAVLGPCPAAAEPYISTTANRAVALAPWPVWFLGIGVVSFVVLPLATRSLLLRSGVAPGMWLTGVWFLSAFHALTGTFTITAMIVVSVAYVDASPLFFVVGWLAFSVLATLLYTAIAKRDASR